MPHTEKQIILRSGFFQIWWFVFFPIRFFSDNYFSDIFPKCMLTKSNEILNRVLTWHVCPIILMKSRLGFFSSNLRRRGPPRLVKSRVRIFFFRLTCARDFSNKISCQDFFFLSPDLFLFRRTRLHRAFCNKKKIKNSNRERRVPREANNSKRWCHTQRNK